MGPKILSKSNIAKNIRHSDSSLYDVVKRQYAGKGEGVGVVVVGYGSVFSASHTSTLTQTHPHSHSPYSVYRCVIDNNSKKKYHNFLLA
jgi:hypothetical protein